MVDKVTFELVLPERLLIAVDADMVVAPGVEGDFAVLPGHQPMISALRAGAVEIYDADKLSRRVFVAGGFAEVSADRFTILAEQATAADQIDRGALKDEIEAARAAVSEAGADEAKSFAASEYLSYLEQMNEAGPAA